MPISATLFRFDPLAKEGVSKGTNKGKKRQQPIKRIPECSCDRCPQIETFSVCCNRDKKAGIVCKGNFDFFCYILPYKTAFSENQLGCILQYDKIRKLLDKVSFTIFKTLKIN